MTIFLLKIYSRWRRLLVAIRNHWPLHRLRWPRNRSRRTEPLKRNRWWRRPKDRPRKARADLPFTIRPTTTCLPKRTRPFWYIIYLDLNAASLDCHWILFLIFSRALWKGNRKAKRRPKRPRLKEERAERTVALPSSQSVCPSAALCLVSSCKSSLSLSLCPTTNF